MENFVARGKSIMLLYSSKSNLHFSQKHKLKPVFSKQLFQVRCHNSMLQIFKDRCFIIAALLILFTHFFSQLRLFFIKLLNLKQSSKYFPFTFRTKKLSLNCLPPAIDLQYPFLPHFYINF